MDSFEWIEMQSLTSEIAASRSRLPAARSSKDRRVVQVLEKEITAAEKRRAHLLAHLANQLVGAPERAPPRVAVEGGDCRPALAPVEAISGDGGEEEQQPVELANRIAASGSAPAASGLTANSVKGGILVWDRLTPGDIERAAKELGVRRAELLARHAEEVKALSADHAQLETLERAIDAFVRKFAAHPATPAS